MRGTYERRVLAENPGWGSGGSGLYWTRDRVVEALCRYVAETRGMLPSSSHEWNLIKARRLDLPTSATVVRAFGSIAGAWLAIGAPRDRVPIGNRPWTEEEITYLLDSAGDLTLEQIGARLHRTWAACRRKIYEHGTRARDAQGYMSASQVAAEYGCTLHHVQRLIARGVLRARRPRGGQQLWRILPDDAAAVADELRHDERPPVDPFDRYLSVQEVADRVGLVPGTVWGYVRSGELPAVRRGRRWYVPERALRGWEPKSMRPLGMSRAERDALPAMRR